MVFTISGLRPAEPADRDSQILSTDVSILPRIHSLPCLSIVAVAGRTTATTTMNIFRLVGDMTHLLSIVILLLKIHATRSCRGMLALCLRSGIQITGLLQDVLQINHSSAPPGIGLFHPFKRCTSCFSCSSMSKQDFKKFFCRCS